MLSNRLALITGAASGIGLETAKLFAKEGAIVVAVDLQASIRHKIHDYDQPKDGLTKHSAFVCDVSNRKHVDELFVLMRTQYPQHRVPTIVVNCAAISEKITFVNSTEDDYDRILDVNLKGTYFITQAACKSLIQEYENVKLASETQTFATIINLSSTLAKVNPQCLPYIVAKAGIEALTKQVAKEMGLYKIRCNVVCPGLVSTPMINKPESEDDIDLFIKETPLGRVGQPHEIAQTCLYLASDMSSFVSGASIVIDGANSA